MHAVSNNSNFENATKIRHQLPHYQFQTIQAIIIWELSEKCYYKHTMTDFAIWVSCYVYIFAFSTYVTTVNQCLTIFFFPKIMCHCKDLHQAN